MDVVANDRRGVRIATHRRDLEGQPIRSEASPLDLVARDLLAEVTIGEYRVGGLVPGDAVRDLKALAMSTVLGDPGNAESVDADHGRMPLLGGRDGWLSCTRPRTTSPPSRCRLPPTAL